MIRTPLNAPPVVIASCNARLCSLPTYLSLHECLWALRFEKGNTDSSDEAFEKVGDAEDAKIWTSRLAGTRTRSPVMSMTVTDHSTKMTCSCLVLSVHSTCFYYR